jgi:hypothetical protein
MRIHTRLTYQWVGDRYILIDEEGYDYDGPIAECKGASAAQDSLAASQTAFYNTLTQDYATQFANQEAIQKSLNTALQPIVAAGPNQFGYSQPELNNLNSTAITGTATAFANAKKSLQEGQAAQGGGNAFLPSGVKAQQDETLASQGADQEASELLGIQNAGYEKGNANFENAIGQTQNLTNSYNPTGFAGSATGAGNSADAEENVITEENNAASPWSTIGGILGGVAGDIGGGFGTSLGTALGKKIG